jgi:hypothetical protein
VALTKHGTTRCLSPRRTHPWWNMGGGGTGGVHRGVAQARHCTPPTPPLKNPHFVEWGGGWGCSPWRRPSTTLNVAYPPTNFTVALHKHGTEWRLSPPLTSPWHRASTALNVAYPHTNQIKNKTYLFLVIYQKRQTTH